MKPYGVAPILWGLCLNASCGGDSAPVGASDAGTDRSTRTPPKVEAGHHGDASDAGATLPIPASCAGQLQPPNALSCTGLYSDITTGTLARAVRAYTPAVPLWADGSTKERWIYLPPGQKIDTTDPSEWTFPVGTRVWKQFSRGGHRVETRFFEKTLTNYWAYGTYQWNADETAATLSPGGDIALPDGGVYQIPTLDECQDCHGGRTDRLLGFEQASLGLAGASGLTLEELRNEGLLAPPPQRTSLVVGDDGTGHAAAPLTWLHINCGVTCHNTNPGALAYALGMNLRLDATELDGRPSNAFPSIVTTEGVKAESPSFPGATRIVTGYPHDSLLYQLIDEREALGASIQMPPIASMLIDVPDVAAVEAWIVAMPRAALVDAGTDGAVDAATDAARDATSDAISDAHGLPPDGSIADGSTADAHARDGGPEASQGDGGVKDATGDVKSD